MSEQCKELTKEEIDALPFDLRLCFEYCPWSLNANFQSVDDWFDRFEVFGIDRSVADLIKFADSVYKQRCRFPTSM